MGAATLRAVASSLITGVSLAIFLSSCAHQLPPIALAPEAERSRLLRECRSIFPAVPWQATHVIEASLPLGNDSSLIGVVAAAQTPAEFRAVLMTEEGIVLFDAIHRDGKVDVRRAVPPISPDGFGRAMIGDVRLLLFEPRGAVTEVGHLETGESVCRFRDGDTTVDVIMRAGRVAQLLRFDSGSLAREVKVGDMDPRGLPIDAWLETKGFVGYSLHLKLLDFEPGQGKGAPLNHLGE